jgi:hypothetical protein
MKFKLNNSKSFFNKDDEDEMRQMKNLEEIGFKFKEDGNEYYKKPHFYNVTEKLTIEIDTLDELMAFIEKFGSVVIDKEEISIYDDYRE